MGVQVTIRLLRAADIDALVELDCKITGVRRHEYYLDKVRAAAKYDSTLNTSLVATDGERIVGFLMGTLFFGECGIPESSAFIDTLGVDPDYQDHGVGGALFEQFRANMRVANVEKIYTFVDWKELGLLKFFAKMGFNPSQRLSLECNLY